jgi:hypothetical protein
MADVALPIAAREQEILNDHVDRVQSLFIDIVDKQLVNVFHELDEREVELERADAERKQAYLSLGQAWCEVDRVNHLLATM